MYCQRQFRQAKTLAVHVCEQKRRYQERDETGVQLGFQSYLRFYEITQGSARLKTFDDFAKSPYYRAFVRYGRHCQAVRAINVSRFTEWLLRNNKKLDHWCRDTVYTEYITEHVRQEAVADALSRALEQALVWSEDTGNPERDYLRYGNHNRLCHDVSTGRLSAWVLYNCESGRQLLNDLNTEQISMIWHMIDSDFWQRRFREYVADTAYVQEMLLRVGW